MIRIQMTGTGTIQTRTLKAQEWQTHVGSATPYDQTPCNINGHPESTRTIAFIEDYYDRWSFPYHECIGGKTRSNNAVIYVRKADEETASKKRQSDSPDDGGVSKKSLLKWSGL